MEFVCLLICDLRALGIDLPNIPTLLVDCAPAFAVANGHSTRSRSSKTKYTDVKVWLRRNYVSWKEIQLAYVPTALLGDFFHQAAWAWSLCCLLCTFMSVLPALIA
jgi:hypothetical protein